MTQRPREAASLWLRTVRLRGERNSAGGGDEGDKLAGVGGLQLLSEPGSLLNIASCEERRPPIGAGFGCGPSAAERATDRQPLQSGM